MKIWDLLVRLLHWLLVITFIMSYTSKEQNYPLHLYSGYSLLGIIIIRFIWGFIGTYHARFKNFIYSPTITYRYIKKLLTYQQKRYIGHNPAGGAMVMILLLMLLIISLSGIALDGAENRAGPLGESTLFYYTESIKNIHIYSSNITVGLIILHIIGVLYSSIKHRENLIWSMLSGYKHPTD